MAPVVVNVPVIEPGIIHGEMAAIRAAKRMKNRHNTTLTLRFSLASCALEQLHSLVFPESSSVTSQTLRPEKQYSSWNSGVWKL